MVKADPAVPLLSVAIGLRVFLVLFLLAPLGFLATALPGGYVAPLLPIFIVYPLLIIGLLVIQIMGLINLTRQEQRRKIAAASSMQGRMALAGQPMPALPPLPMPFTLRLGPNLPLLALIYVLPILIVVALGAVLINIDSATGAPDLAATIIPSLAVALLIVVGYSVLITFALRQRIEVNQFGITLQRGFQKTSLYWEAVALFAQVRAVPFRRDAKRIALYELSNTQVLMRFIVPRTRWSPMLPQGMSLADYDRQMALLMQYIAVRTGLPLVDVR